MAGQKRVEIPASQLPAPGKAYAGLPPVLCALLVLAGLIVTLAVLIYYGLLWD